jgi:tRNA pseudouridine38-40 synthase
MARAGNGKAGQAASFFPPRSRYGRPSPWRRQRCIGTRGATGMRIALGLEYDGSGFCGWQSQAGGGAVQDALEAALAVVARRAGAGGLRRAHGCRRACAGAGGAFRYRGRSPGYGVGARRQCASAGKRGRALGATGAGRVPCALFGARPALSLSACSIAASVPALMAQRVGWFHRPLDESRCARRRACCSANMTSRPFVPSNARPSRRSRPCAAPTRAPWRPAGIRLRGQRFPAPHGAQPGRHAGVRRQGRPSAVMGRRAPGGSGSFPRRADFDACGLYFAGVDYDPVWQLKVGAGDTALIHPLIRSHDPHPNQDLRHHPRGRPRRGSRRRRRCAGLRVLSAQPALRHAATGGRIAGPGAGLRDPGRPFRQ